MRLRGVTVHKESHRHSYLSEILYGAYLENNVLRELIGIQSLAKASTSSHSDVDLEKACEPLYKMLHALRSTIPYLTEGKSHTEALEQERARAIEEYHEYVRNTLGDEKYHEYLREKLGEEDYLKFIESRKDNG